MTTMIRDWIRQHAARNGDACYLREGTGTAALSYAELERSVVAWEEHLDGAGIAPGASVAVSLPDPLSYAAALVGIVAAGRVAVPLDPAAPAAEHARVLTLAESAGVSDTGGIFLCTSGSTGTPKAILLREDQLAHVAAGIAAHHRLTPADRGYCCLPLFHVNAEVVGVLSTLCAGACLVLDAKFSRSRFWSLIAEHQITWINAVPAIITLLTLEPTGDPQPQHVRFVRSASAPLPPATLERFEKAYEVPVIETYGMTEAASMITANPLDGPRKAGSAGVPVGLELRITRPVQDGSAPCEAYETGLVQIRGRGVIRAYASPGRTGIIDQEGWLVTGDLGYLDQDGYLFLAGRSDDVINRGGEKIYPRDIEDFLLTQPGVLSAAVVPVPDEILGERPVAYIVPTDAIESAVSITAALHQACKAGLPRHKRPSEIVVVEQLPLGPTGKLARRRLRELAEARAAG
jgi:acyl-CoA synthetase (AMP-forming)/AMP-acid ligase II